MKERTYSKIIANAINSFLVDDDWNFTFDEQKGLFKFNLNIKGKLQRINYIIKVKHDAYIVYAISPLCVEKDDETAMASMAEFICRANYGLDHGSFEFDMRDGEIRYKYNVDCDGITPTDKMIKNSIYCPASMYERYGSGIINIIFGIATAKDAIEKCEELPEDIRAFLEEENIDIDDLESMVSRLAARFGIDDGEPDAADPTVNTNLFETNGGEM